MKKNIAVPHVKEVKPKGEEVDEEKNDIDV